MAYNTSQANNIDYMYQLPENALLQAIVSSDQQIDKIGEQTDAFDKYIASINALPANQDRVKEISNKYKTEIENVRNTISKDPANYRQHLPAIRTLSRQLQNDNDLKTIQSQYTQYQDWLKNNKDADPTIFEAAQKSLINQGAYDKATNKYSTLNLPQVSKTIDFAKKAKEWHEGMIPMSSDGSHGTYADIVNGKIKPNSAGQYYVDTESGKKWVDKERILENFNKNYSSDLEAQRFVQQSNQYLPAKSFLQPNIGYEEVNNVTPRMITKEIPAGDYMLQSAKEAAVGKYAFKETKSKSEIKMSDAWKYFDEKNAKKDEQQRKEGYEREKIKEEHEFKKQQDINDLLNQYHDATDSPGVDKATGKKILGPKQVAAQKTLEAMGYSATGVVNSFIEAQKENPVPVVTNNTATQSSTTKTTPVTTASKTTPVVAPKEPIKYKDGKVNVNYFAGDNKLDASKVAGNIQSTQHNIDVLTKDLARYISGSPEFLATTEEISRQKLRLNNQVGIQNQVDEIATEKAIKKMKSDGIIDANNNLTYNWDNNSNLNVQTILKAVKSGVIPYVDGLKEGSPEQIKNTKIKNEYLKIKKIYDETIKDAYQTASTTANQPIETVGITNVEGTKLLNKAMGNRVPPKIIDGETGTDMTKQEINIGSAGLISNEDVLRGKGAKVTLSLDPTINNSLGAYLVKNNKKLEDVVKVKGITHAHGYGTVAIVNIGNGTKDFMMQLPSNVATDYAISNKPTNDKERALRNNIVNQTKGAALDEIMPAINLQLPLVQKGATPVPIEYRTILNDKEVKAQIIPQISSDGQLVSIKVKAKDKDGNWVDYPDNTYPSVQSFLDKLIP